MRLKHNYFGLNISNIEKVPVGVCCISLHKVYKLKPYIYRREFIEQINQGIIKAYCTFDEIFITVETFNKITKCQQRYFTPNVKNATT